MGIAQDYRVNYAVNHRVAFLDMSDVAAVRSKIWNHAFEPNSRTYGIEYVDSDGPQEAIILCDGVEPNRNYFRGALGARKVSSAVKLSMNPGALLRWFNDGMNMNPRLKVGKLEKMGD